MNTFPLSGPFQAYHDALMGAARAAIVAMNNMWNQRQAVPAEPASNDSIEQAYLAQLRPIRDMIGQINDILVPPASTVVTRWGFYEDGSYGPGGPLPPYNY